jgi:hypothetical protein
MRGYLLGHASGGTPAAIRSGLIMAHTSRLNVLSDDDAMDMAKNCWRMDLMGLHLMLSNISPNKMHTQYKIAQAPRNTTHDLNNYVHELSKWFVQASMDNTQLQTRQRLLMLD